MSPSWNYPARAEPSYKGQICHILCVKYFPTCFVGASTSVQTPPADMNNQITPKGIEIGIQRKRRKQKIESEKKFFGEAFMKEQRR